MGQRKNILSSHEESTSDLCILHSDALPLSHRDSVVSDAHLEVHMKVKWSQQSKNENGTKNKLLPDTACTMGK